MLFIIFIVYKIFLIWNFKNMLTEIINIINNNSNYWWEITGDIQKHPFLTNLTLEWSNTMQYVFVSVDLKKISIP